MDAARTGIRATRTNVKPFHSGVNNEEEAAREQVSQAEARDMHREDKKEEKETADAGTAIERSTRRRRGQAIWRTNEM